MSERKTRLTVTTDPQLASSAGVNDALEADRLRDQKALRLWKEAADRADPEKVARMRAHVDAQLAALPASHRIR
jgi:hypothetical protein